MFERTKATKTVILLIIVVAMLAAGLILTYILSNNDTDVEIVLPSPTAALDAEPTAEIVQTDTLLSVSPENVKSVLSTVDRPTSYQRSLEISIINGENVATQTADVWVRDNSQYFEITDGRVKRHVVIADGRINIWYDGEENIHSFEENEYFSADDLIGIPTYEDILKTDESLITSADYVADADGVSSLYVEFVSEDSKYQYRYWISLETGLLNEAVTLYNGETVYSMRETFMQQLPATDTEFDDKFVIPGA